MTVDQKREVQKAVDVIQKVHDHFSHEAAMNAALHMSDKIRPAPLAVAVEEALDTLKRLIGEGSIKTEAPDDRA